MHKLPLFSPISYLSVVVASCFPLVAQADDEFDTIEVTGHLQQNTANMGALDTILKQQGVDFSAAGGVSALPVINGMTADKVKVLLDGADISVACANQMNPPLSYLSASQVSQVSVLAGVSPVSVAGDNIAGVIQVKSTGARFANSAEFGWQAGYVSGEYRSNNKAKRLGVGLALASDNFSIDYQGHSDKAQSYEDGNGNLVFDTLYKAENHLLTTAYKQDNQLWLVKLTHQQIPYQGYPNQYMDMTKNRSNGALLEYTNNLENGEFSARVNWHKVSHEMGFFTPEKMGMMPMNTEAEDKSYRLSYQFAANAQTRILLGHELFDYQLDDWWPGMPDSMMMGPLDYLNINNGKRKRTAVFAEVEQNINPDFYLNYGARIEQVTTNADEAQAYNTMPMNADFMAMQQFNTSDRKQQDTLLDLSLIGRYSLDNNSQIEFGLAQKNRAPNLYERYSWGRGVMATSMIGWFGSGNGYVGDIELKPETARTLSIKFSKMDAAAKWQFDVSGYYTKVDDYIDAVKIGQFNRSDNPATLHHILQFTNVDARLYGLKANWLNELASNESGVWQLQLSADKQFGRNADSHSDLYQIKPLELTATIKHQLGNWQNSLSWQWLDDKIHVDLNRLENTTESNHLLNLESQYEWDNVTLSLSIDNLLDEYYQLPLGGVSIADVSSKRSDNFAQLAGEGRSVNLGVVYRF
ncbi:TonB-dependent receptor [Neptunicella marina]|uniref:TonB-dependent receptor n=1 Tax=Neptunicella marina TaxID=2125989 RepID=UPI0030CA2C6B